MQPLSVLSPALLLTVLLSTCDPAPKKETEAPATPLYTQAKAPLTPSAYLPLPLGNIHPQGWLKENLQRMATGMTGQLDELYPEVLGPRNGWLGGDGDGWERGPYWIDGLLPLAHLLDDEALKAKANKWVEWTLDNQTDNGYLGPIPFTEKPAYEPGLQRGQRRDWWPKMVMLKVFVQHYEATQDERVITALTRYFRYQLNELPNRALDADTFWANRRGADNLQVVHWLYNRTGDDFLLDLADLLAEQTFPWHQVFANDPAGLRQRPPWSYARTKPYPFDPEEIAAITLADEGTIHCVNLAQGLKQPAVRYQNSGDSTYLHALKRGLADLRKYHGQVQGMYSGDEPLHGTDPTRGVEFCSVSEEMFSLESILQITGDVAVADLLERIAYNALPTQAADDFSGRQYFQAANQIELRRNSGTSFENNNHQGTDYVFGVKTGYPCCTTNMHQSWPKFVQNLFYATPDRGVAALQYAPSSVDLLVADSVQLKVTETTGYPFRDLVTFELSLSGEVDFPFHLRIPEWTEGAQISVNGTEIQAPSAGTVAVVERVWQDGDVLELRLPLTLRSSTWHDFSQAVERGPLVFALGVPAKETVRQDDHYGSYREFSAAAAWNYGLLKPVLRNLDEKVEVVERDWDGRYPWNLAAAPVALQMKGLLVPEWTAENGVPHLPNFWGNYTRHDDYANLRDITLVPYGCTMLRISEFPAYEVSDGNP